RPATVAVVAEPWNPQPIALPPLLAVVAEAPLPLQPIAAATLAFFSHAAFVAPVHCAPVIACAEQPPSALTAGTCPFDEATTAFAVVEELPLLAFAVFGASHAQTAEAVQAKANMARASSRNDFMDPTSRKVVSPRTRSIGERTSPSWK